ncbi:hypothetical protein JOQ06_009045, partial [Pogonophryne albipinna]
MSEDEADEDACGHMDKENQQPNDPPVSDYVDIEPQQHKPTKPHDREKCLQVVPEEHNSVDEMMIPFKGKFSSIKQYMRGKPHPWGFKVWVRTGMICDFDMYQGSVNGIRAKSELGLSGDVGMKLASTLPVEEKSLKKKGSFDIRVETNHNICAVKWYDSRAVTLVSSFAGPHPVQNIKRWDKANKTYVEVERPSIVATYNKLYLQRSQRLNQPVTPDPVPYGNVKQATPPKGVKRRVLSVRHPTLTFCHPKHSRGPDKFGWVTEKISKAHV